MGEPRSRLAGDAALSTLGILLSGGAQFLVSVTVGRVFGPATLGVVRAALALANATTLLWPSSAGQTASLFVAKEVAAGKPALAQGIQRHLATGVGVALAVSAPVAGAVAVHLFGFSWWDAVWVAALVMALGMYQLARGVRFGHGRVARATWAEAANALLSTTLLLVVLWLNAPGWVLAPLVTGNVVYAWGVWLQIVRSRGERPGDELKRELGSFVLWGVAGTAASTGLLQVTMVIAKAVSQPDEAGFYAAAISMATPLSMVARALSTALFPEMARQRGRGDDEATRRVTDRATRGLVVVMTPGFSIMILMAEHMVRLVYGTSYQGAVTPMRILLVAVLISTIPVAATNSINVRGAAGVRFSALLSWIGFVIGMAAIVALVPVFGIEGVAWGYLVGVATTSTLSLGWVWHRDGHQWLLLTLGVIAGPVAAIAGVGWVPSTEEPVLASITAALLLVLWGAGVAVWTRPPRYWCKGSGR